MPERRRATAIRAAVCGMLAGLTGVFFRNLLFRQGKRGVGPFEPAAGEDRARNETPPDRNEAGALEMLRQSGDLDTISGVLAHDLRNPLNTIGLNVHLARTALAEGDQELGALAVSHIERSKQQMVESVDRFRALARASFGQLATEPVPMGELARGLGERLRSAEPPPEVEVVVGDLPVTQGDPKLAAVLLWGLLASALEATRGRPQRRVEVGCRAGSGPVTFYVSDDGPDLDQHKPGPVWRRTDGGSQVDPWLDLAARAVIRHGGMVDAANRPGGGVTVWFRLTGAQPDPDDARSGAPDTFDSRPDG